MDAQDIVISGSNPTILASLAPPRLRSPTCAELSRAVSADKVPSLTTNFSRSDPRVTEARSSAAVLAKAGSDLAAQPKAKCHARPKGRPSSHSKRAHELLLNRKRVKKRRGKKREVNPDKKEEAIRAMFACIVV